MKKFLLIILITFILNGVALAEKINLACTAKGSDMPPFSVVLNTDNKKVSWQGGYFAPYFLRNDVFYFVMTLPNPPLKAIYALNRNTGHLVIKTYEFTDEKERKLADMMIKKMIQDGKTTDDKEYEAELIYDTLNSQIVKDNFNLQCDKAKAKF